MAPPDTLWRESPEHKYLSPVFCNEKYKGEDLLQKGFTVDFLTKKRKVNEARCHSTM